MTRHLARVLLVALVMCTVAGCGSTVATVEGTAIERSDLDRLHPQGAEIDDAEQAADLLLLILHQLLPAAARREFGVRITADERRAAFADRAGDPPNGSDTDTAPRSRTTTRDRVLLESDLDVIRHELETLLIRSEASGFDFDAAYRTFLSVNSRVCLSALQVSDATAVDDIGDLVDSGADVARVEDVFPDAVARVDVDCASPTQLGPGLSSLALDGDVGETHVVSTDQGLFVAAVDRRDAPPPDEVRDEVRTVAVETQGPDLFNAWAADVIRGADVEIVRSVGRWEPTEQTRGVPTVVPAG